MHSLTISVLLLAATCLGSTVALAPCDSRIVEGLKKCYTSGQPPSQKSGGSLGTTVIVPKGQFKDAFCITSYQDSSSAHVTLFTNNGASNTSYTYSHVYGASYIEGTDDAGNVFLLYVIYNEKATYAYYRCSKKGGQNTGTHDVYVAVGCKYATNTVTLEMVKTAEKCFNQLGITNYESKTACQC